MAPGFTLAGPSWRQVNGPWVSQRAQGGADKEEEEVELNKYKSQEEKIKYVRVEEGH